MKVCFETFGCRLNKAEALQMEAEYLAKGWELTEKHSEADLFVVRGCSVTARAQYECEKLISHLRRRYPIVPLRICGCLENKDQPFSSRHLVKQPKAQAARQAGDQADRRSAIPPLPVRTARAYLKVQDGCSGNCTFCIVPKFRGASVSVPLTGLIDTSRRFIDAGYHEIVVTGCNLSLYASEGKRLPDLIAALAELSPDCRIRIGSLEPGGCALETVRAVAEHPNICRFLHIPIQSGSNRILTAMKRPYLIRDVEALITSAVKHLPGLGLGCDLMTGFPDESDLDFDATKGLLRRYPFNNAHIFHYSERPGTLAMTFGGTVPRSIRRTRAHKLASIARESRAKFARSFVGKTVAIVVEDKSKPVGWTDEYLKCEAVGAAPRKSLVHVHVKSIKGDVLSGRVAEETLLPLHQHETA